MTTIGRRPPRQAGLGLLAAMRTCELPEPTATLRSAPSREAGFKAAQANRLSCQ